MRGTNLAAKMTLEMFPESAAPQPESPHSPEPLDLGAGPTTRKPASTGSANDNEKEPAPRQGGSPTSLPAPSVVAWDMGRGAKSVAYRDGEFAEVKGIMELVEGPAQITLVEKSGRSYDPRGWTMALTRAKELGKRVLVLPPRQTKNLRLDIGLSKPADADASWDYVDAFIIRLAYYWHPEWFVCAKPAGAFAMRGNFGPVFCELETVRRHTGYVKRDPFVARMCALLPENPPRTLTDANGKYALPFVLPVVADILDHLEITTWEDYKTFRGFHVQGHGNRIRESVYRTRLRTIIRRDGKDRNNVILRREYLKEIQHDLRWLFNGVRQKLATRRTSANS